MITIITKASGEKHTRQRQYNIRDLSTKSGSEVQLRSQDQRSGSSQRSDIKKLMQEDKQQSSPSQNSIAFSFTINQPPRFDSKSFLSSTPLLRFILQHVTSSRDFTQLCSINEVLSIEHLSTISQFPNSLSHMTQHKTSSVYAEHLPSASNQQLFLS